MRTGNGWARALGGAVLALAVAAPAGADTIYSWRTDDGGYAFTDDARRIPPRYRARAETRQLDSIRTYPRFTPQDPAAADRHAQELAAWLEHLRAQNAAPPPVAPAEGPAVVVRTPPDGEPVVEVLNPAEGDEPIVIEERRVRVPGTLVTRENRIVRQGDRVLAIVRPRATGIGHTTDLLFDDDEE